MVLTTKLISTATVGGGTDTVTATHDAILSQLVSDYHANVPPPTSILEVQQQSSQLLSLNVASLLAAKANTAGEQTHLTKLTLVSSTYAPQVSSIVSGISTDAGHQTFALLNTDGSYAGVDSLVGANDILVDGSGTAGYNLFALNLAYTGTAAVVLKGVDAAILSAPGTVRVDGSAPIVITSDSQAQNITGGDGNDTLVGSGNDTLTGGAGSDLFAVNATGHYTITDFNKSVDKLAVEFAGVGNIDQLNTKVTSVVKTTAGVTYNFGPDSSVTLVGVSPADLTASMLAFKIIG